MLEDIKSYEVPSGGTILYNPKTGVVIGGTISPGGRLVIFTPYEGIIPNSAFLPNIANVQSIGEIQKDLRIKRLIDAGFSYDDCILAIQSADYYMPPDKRKIEWICQNIGIDKKKLYGYLDALQIPRRRKPKKPRK